MRTGAGKQEVTLPVLETVPDTTERSGTGLAWRPVCTEISDDNEQGDYPDD